MVHSFTDSIMETQVINIETVKTAVKAQKWDKYSYAYALDHIYPHSLYAHSLDIYKKVELVEKFYTAIQDPAKFARVKSFTTFRNLDVYEL